MLCWEVPHHVTDAHVGALVEGTLLAAYAFREYKSDADSAGAGHADPLAPTTTSAAPAARRGGAWREATNSARNLQNRPANDLTPEALEAARAGARGRQRRRARPRAGIVAAGMGAFACVAQGSQVEPRLITIRYEPADVTGPLLGFVGKAVTFDSGGISIKPAAKMHEMKFDMSGGAAVLEAVGAIARLGLPVRVAGVIGATENLPSGHAVKPGDIVRAKSGVTIEVNNTDAEGRLVLADCLAHAIDLGAERLVDLATLTGAIVVALGTPYAGLFANDDAWAGEITRAGERTGEIVWRHAAARGLREADRGPLRATSSTPRPTAAAASSTAAEFLHRFVGRRPVGRTSTSPASPTTTASPTRPRAAPAGASACSSSWQRRTGAPDLHYLKRRQGR